MRIAQLISIFEPLATLLLTEESLQIGDFAFQRRAASRCSPYHNLSMTVKPQMRRGNIFEYICSYAEEMSGPTPTINEVARHFGVNYKTAYRHVMKLISEGRLRQERGKLTVVNGTWTRPSLLSKTKRFNRRVLPEMSAQRKFADSLQGHDDG